MSLKDLDIKLSYISCGEENIAKSFLVPALKHTIEKKERELQANKMNADNRAKNDIIKSIMDELERETTNENN